jgi:hypothetical protein
VLFASGQEGSADDLEVMSISLNDVVRTTFGFQGVRTSNQAGIGEFCLSLSSTVAFGSLKPLPTSTSLIVRTTAAASTPLLLAPPPASPQDWAINHDPPVGFAPVNLKTIVLSELNHC